MRPVDSLRESRRTVTLATAASTPPSRPINATGEIPAQARLGSGSRIRITPAKPIPSATQSRPVTRSCSQAMAINGIKIGAVSLSSMASARGSSAIAWKKQYIAAIPATARSRCRPGTLVLTSPMPWRSSQGASSINPIRLRPNTIMAFGNSAETTRMPTPIDAKQHSPSTMKAAPSNNDWGRDSPPRIRLVDGTRDSGREPLAGQLAESRAIDQRDVRPACVIDIAELHR